MKSDMRLTLNRYAGPMRKSIGRTLRVTMLITVAFILKVLNSCIHPVRDFDCSFNRITIRNLDNSGIYAPETDRDIMYTSAVAIIFAAVIHPVQRVNHSFNTC